MEHPREERSSKEGDGTGDSSDQFHDVEGTRIPRLLQLVPASPGVEQAWSGDPQSSPTFFSRLVELVGFYTELAKVTPERQHGRNVRYSGIVLIEKEHQDVGDIIALQLASAEQGKTPVYRLLPDATHGDPVQTHDQAIPDIIEYMKLNAPLVVIGNDAGDGLARQVMQDIARDGFLDSKIIMIVLVTTIDSMDKETMARADFTFSIVHPSFEERAFYMKYLLGPDRGVDHGAVVKEMEGWTWDDIEKFCKHSAFQQHLIGVEGLSTNFLLDLLHPATGRDAFMPPSRAGSAPQACTREGGAGKEVTPVPRVVVAGEFHDPFKEQLWQVAATTDHEALVAMLDRLDRGTITLEDQRLLARYPFLLKEDPVIARKLLDTAKNKVDLLARTFKTKSQ